MLYAHHTKVLDVYDGDTCTALIDLGLGIFKKETIRLNGINCPEIKTKNIKEKELGGQARQFTIDRIFDKEVEIVTHKEEKFGRYLADIYYYQDGEKLHLNSELIKAGLAKEYFGERRAEWI